jgi:hypothetical protein
MPSVHRFVSTALLAVAGSALLSGAFTSGCSTSASSGGGDTDGSGSTSGSGAGEPDGTGGSSGAEDSSGGGSSGSGGSSGTTSSGGASGTSSGGAGSTSSGGSSGASQDAASTDATTVDSSTASPDASGMSSEWGTPVAGGPMGTGTSATVTVNPNTTVGTVDPTFVGFSYEKTHITNDSLNSTNTNLVGLYKLLGSPVMRLGANDVDNCHWAGTGTAPAAPSGEPFTLSITSGMVDELCSFLQATGTKIIYGVNYKADNVSASAAEAAYAMGKCGSSIIGFEIGNEINKYGSWDSLKSQWESFATAIVATPGALLVGPAADAGGYGSLSVPFAADESAKFGSKLVLLTQHYYAGIANSGSATVVTLQEVPPVLVSTDTTLNTAAVSNKILDGYRLGETNTFEQHGQMGVSDTLVAGLWTLDMMLLTVEHGGSGVNFHGGETGMDGTRPFYYEPVMENKGAVVQVQPVYYGMLLFSLAGEGPMVSTSATTSATDFSAYAIKASGFTSVVLDNKNATTGVNATVNLGSAVSSASAIYLQGTPGGSLTASASDVTLAGAQVSPAGVWNRNPPYIQTTSGNTASVYVPPASAVLVRVLMQ